MLGQQRLPERSGEMALGLDREEIGPLPPDQDHLGELVVTLGGEPPRVWEAVGDVEPDAHFAIGGGATSMRAATHGFTFSGFFAPSA
jgi:hypothetical protein